MLLKRATRAKVQVQTTFLSYEGANAKDTGQD